MRKGIVAYLSLILLSVFVAWQTGISFGYPQPPSGYHQPPSQSPQENQAQNMAQLNGNLQSLWTGKLMECDDGWYPNGDNCDACSDPSCAEKHGFYKTWGQKKGGNCYFAYSDCAWSIDLGFTSICLRTANHYCCYDSKFSKMLVQEAYRQLGNSAHSILPGLFSSGNVCEQLSVYALKRLDFTKLNPELRAWLQEKMQGGLGGQLDGNTILNEVQQGVNHMYGNYQGDSGINMIENIYNNNNNGNNNISNNSIIKQLQEESQNFLNSN